MRFTRSGHNSLLSLVVITACLIVGQALLSTSIAKANSASIGTASSASTIDPDIIDSEWNHHLAGYILIGIALLVLASHCFSSLDFLKGLWPFLFLAAGLYLAAWSDKEIWPRGFLSWTWLLHHDAEARQHKIYALLLLIMGAIEYLRWRGKLGLWGRTWAFPLVALIGACLLLVHDHGGNSGLPPGWDSAQKSARIAEMARASGRDLIPADATEANVNSEHVMKMARGDHDMPGMTMSSPADSPGGVSSSTNSGPHQESGHKGHIMTSSMLHVKAEHLWFTLVGVAIALFKFIDDGSFWRKRFVPYLWPSGVLVLGVLLAVYTEMP
jgi:hypothetical protein